MIHTKSLKGKTLVIQHDCTDQSSKVIHRNLQYSFNNVDDKMVFNSDYGVIALSHEIYQALCNEGYYFNDNIVAVVTN